jgi:hypothetical protein
VERDATGTIVTAKEITSDAADIEWTVHLDNRKAIAFKMLSLGTKAVDRRGLEDARLLE